MVLTGADYTLLQSRPSPRRGETHFFPQHPVGPSADSPTDPPADLPGGLRQSVELLGRSGAAVVRGFREE